MNGERILIGSLIIPGKDTVSVRVLNTDVAFQVVQGSMLIYKVLGGTLKAIIVGFMIVLSGAMREKIIIVKQIYCFSFACIEILKCFKFYL